MLSATAVPLLTKKRQSRTNKEYLRTYYDSEKVINNTSIPGVYFVYSHIEDLEP